MTQSPHDPPLAYLTADTPGVGGTIKQRPGDFLVEEHALYEPAGEGEHVYIYIEKQSLTTPQVVRELCKRLDLPRAAVGFAGLKDRQAVTRQHFSLHIPGRAEDDPQRLAPLRDASFAVLWIDRHRNKLRRGHLAGNRFVIRVRQADPLAVVRAKSVLDVLATRGVPNYFGPQRFGMHGINAQLGGFLLADQPQALLDLLLGQDQSADNARVSEMRTAYRAGDFAAALRACPRQDAAEMAALRTLSRGRDAHAAVRAIDRRHRELLTSAWQSQLFNQVLDARLRAGACDRLLEGDLAWKHDNGAVFEVDAETAQKENAPDGRVPELAVSPSGPLWGPKMTRAHGQPGGWEEQALKDSGITLDQLAAARDAGPGVRRPLRVALTNPDVSGGVDEHGGYIRLAFDLPAGAYATAVLREIIKPAPDAPIPPDDEESP